MKSIRLKYVLLLCMAASFLFIAIPIYAADEQMDRYTAQDLRVLAERMNDSTLSESRKIGVEKKLKALSRNEALELRKIWRALLVEKGMISEEETFSFSSIEKFEAIFSNKITERFGKDKTIFNISLNELSAVERSLSGDSTVARIVRSLENPFKSVMLASIDDHYPSLVFDCPFVPVWPVWMRATIIYGSGEAYQGDSVGRVRNNADAVCDFIIHIPANTYTRVTGTDIPAQSIVNWHRGLTASSSRDSVLLGFNRVLLFGFANEKWVKEHIVFKK